MPMQIMLNEYNMNTKSMTNNTKQNVWKRIYFTEKHIEHVFSQNGQVQITKMLGKTLRGQSGEQTQTKATASAFWTYADLGKS